MAHKGDIHADSVVTATFTANAGNAGSTSDAITFARIGGNAESDFVMVAPAGSDEVSMTLDLQGCRRGIFTVWIDMANETDSGQLVVSSNGLTLPGSDSIIFGDITWVYSVY